MRYTLPTRATPLALALLVAMTGIAAAPLPAATGPPPVTQASIGESGVELIPDGAYSRAILEVSGGEVEFRRTFASGERPAIGRLDPQGRPLPDGTYRWRLSFLPDPATARALRAAARADDGEAPDTWRAQMGSFTIAGGSFVDPDLVEPPVRRQESQPGLRSAPQPGFESLAAELRRLAQDSDVSVAAGLCETDLHAALPSPGAALLSPDGAGLASLDSAAGLDSDASILSGALAEAGAAGRRPEAATSTTLAEPEGADRANGRSGGE